MSLTFDRLQSGTSYVNPADGTFMLAFIVYWQQLLSSLEDVIADLQTVNDAQSDIIADLAAQLAAIQAVQRSDALSASYTVPSAVLTASDVGSDATITIADHTRFYGDTTSLAVTGAALTGLAYSTLYAVYYDDTTRADTTPTFVATTNRTIAQYNYVAGRHFVGEVTTPASGGGSTTGGTTPPGGGGGGLTP